MYSVCRVAAAMKSVQLAVLAVCLCAVSAGSWLPEKLVKKFAMKKVSKWHNIWEQRIFSYKRNGRFGQLISIFLFI